MFITPDYERMGLHYIKDNSYDKIEPFDVTMHLEYPIVIGSV